jgi:predicted negative regulator of RcsB-dependent stress response
MARSFRRAIREPDTLQALAGWASDFYSAYAKIILSVVAAALLLGGGFIGYRVWDAQIREKASLALAIARGKSPGGPEAEVLLKKAADEFPGTKSGKIAGLRLAMLLRERGDHQGAEREYRKLLKAGNLVNTDLEIARRGLAGSLSLQGKCDEAVSIWRDILGAGSLITPEDIYVSMGGCLEVSGKPTEALKVYEELIQKHPGSPYITAQLRARMRALDK